jgi:hypothetical protein
MTSDDRVNQPESLTLPRNTPEALLIKAATPMNETQTQAFGDRLAKGFNPVSRMQPTTQDTLSPDIEFQTPDGAPSGGKPLAETLYQWLAESLTEHFGTSPRAFANLALGVFGHPPFSNDQLRTVFEAFAIAYERMVIVRSGIQQSEIPVKDTDGVTIEMASAFPGRTLERLERLNDLSKRKPQDAAIFRLAEFAGCTPEEIATYLNLDLPVTELRDRLIDLRYDIYHVN